MNSLFSFVKKNKKKRILILTHKAADVDAIASAACIKLAFSKFKITIGIAGYLNQEAKTMADKFNIQHELNPILSKFDALIIVDFNTLEMIGHEAPAFQNFKGPCFLIDHHSKTSDSISVKNALINPKAVSTTEILFQTFKKSKIKISPTIAQLLAAGLISDSANFTTASYKTFQNLSELLRISNKQFAEIVRLFSLPADISQRIASLKAAKRVQLFKASNFIIASSQVSCFENAAADSLILSGADVAFVGFLNEQNQARISARASQSLVLKTGFDLAKLFQNLEEKFDGFSGGHAGAAGFSGNAAELAPLLEECVKLSFEFLKSKNLAQELKKLKE